MTPITPLEMPPVVESGGCDVVVDRSVVVVTTAAVEVVVESESPVEPFPPHAERTTTVNATRINEVDR